VPLRRLETAQIEIHGEKISYTRDRETGVVHWFERDALERASEKAMAAMMDPKNTPLPKFYIPYGATV